MPPGGGVALPRGAPERAAIAGEQKTPRRRTRSSLPLQPIYGRRAPLAQVRDGGSLRPQRSGSRAARSTGGPEETG